MQCKDIQDKPILKFLQNMGRACTHGSSHFTPTVQDAMPDGTPRKLQLAKMRMLLKRGLIEGCTCGCRGDFEITEKGVNFLNNQ